MIMTMTYILEKVMNLLILMINTIDLNKKNYVFF